MGDALIKLFDSLSETIFWIKDRDLRILAANRAFAEHVNRPPEDIVGRTDADFYFPELARTFMADDRQVIKTGVAIEQKVELLANRFGGVEWRVVSKHPIRNPEGEVVGTTGVSQPFAESTALLPAPYQAFSRIVDYARNHLADGVDVRHIAHYAGMSVSTLARRFKEHISLTPREFLAQLRISRACKLLKQTPLNISEVSLQCGYESPAAFTRAFKRQMRVAPKDYRSGNPNTGYHTAQAQGDGAR